MKRVLNWLVRKLFCYYRILEEKDKLDWIGKSATLGSNVVFYPESKVINLQNDKLKIIINEGSQIRGSLLVNDGGGRIIIGKNCYIGDLSRLNSGESIEIGDNVLISHGVNIYDNDSHEIDSEARVNGYLNFLDNGVIFNKSSIKSQKIVVESNVWICLNSVILKGVTIGKGSIVAAGSIVTKDVPPNTIVAGNPAILIKKI